MIETPPVGVYPGVPFDQYQQWEAVNDSLLSVLVNLSPAHAKAYQEEPETSDAFRVGHGLHTRLLEPDRFAERYAIRPECDRRTNAGKAVYEEFLSSLDGREELTTAEAKLIEQMGRAIEKKTIHRFMQAGQAEVCILWKDPRTGLLCKARLDYWQEALTTIIDLKTTARYATFDGFAGEIFRYQYYQKAAFYCDGMKVLTGKTYSFVFFVLEKHRPYENRAWEADDEMLLAGRKAYCKALEIYRQCMATNDWPGYPDRVDIISLPQWALNKAGVGPYNLITEEEQNGDTKDKKYSSGSIATEWNEFERDARDAESGNTEGGAGQPRTDDAE